MDASAQVDSDFCSITKIVSEFGLKRKNSHGRRQFTQEEYKKLKLICKLGRLNVSDSSTSLGESSINNPDCDTVQNSPELIDAEICRLKKQEQLLDDLLDEILNSSVDMDNYLMKALLLYAERE
jgi:hypothetical protein